MKYNIYNIVILIILFIIGCNSDNSIKSGYSDSLKNNTFKLPVIIDTINYKATDYNIKWLNFANYFPLYIGLYQDTIFVDYSLIAYPPLPAPPGISYDTIKYNHELNNSKLKKYYTYVDLNNKKLSKNNFIKSEYAKLIIIIDTLHTIKNFNPFINSDSYFVKAYPVIIKNIDNDTVLMCIENRINLIMEAKDINGIWKPIEEKFEKWIDIGGYSEFILPPNNIIITSAVINHGNFKTSLRLKLGQNYSNIFQGYINKRQFETEYDSVGNKKKGYN